MPISPLRSVKILNYASTIDDRVVLFRWIKKKGKKKKRRKGMRGFFFFFFFNLRDRRRLLFYPIYRKREG